MEQLTIYTATYNRKETIPRVYESLCAQTDKNFRWMIIDDGSTDGTKEMVDKWLCETNDFQIDYFYKNNGGIHTVRDFAYKHCETELILGVDSDDWICRDTVCKILDLWNESDREKYAGIYALAMYPDGKTVGENFPNFKSISYQELTYKYYHQGPRLTVVRTDVIKKIPSSPIYESERLVAEGYKWIQLPETLPFLLINEPLKIVEYQQDGYSKNIAKIRFQNMKGFRASARQHIISAKYFRVRIKNQIKYIMYSVWLKDKAFIKNSPKPIQTVLLFPIGLVSYIIVNAKWKRYKE